MPKQGEPGKEIDSALKAIQLGIGAELEKERDLRGRKDTAPTLEEYAVIQKSKPNKPRQS